MFGIDLAILSSVTGGLSGLIGHWFKAREEKDKRAYELELIEVNMRRDKLNSELAIREIEANIRVQESITEGQIIVEEAKGFNQAVAQISKNTLPMSTLENMLKAGLVQRFLGGLLAFLLGVVDVLRGMVRPVLTFGAFWAIVHIGNGLVNELAFTDVVDEGALLEMIVAAIIYVMTSATSFWFLDRHGARSFRKKH